MNPHTPKTKNYTSLFPKDFTLNKENIKKHLFDSIGRPNTARLRWWGISKIDMYLAYHEIEHPTCKHPNCDKPALFINFFKGFRDYCSAECANGKDSPKWEKTEKTNLKRHGAKNVFSKESSKYEKVRKNSKKALEEIGYHLPTEHRSDFKNYHNAVYRITYSQPLHLLENFEKRGMVNKEGSYHLDHKYSIKKGFENNILPYYIGHINNLEMLPAKENIKKQDHCSITEEELFMV